MIEERERKRVLSYIKAIFEDSESNDELAYNIHNLITDPERCLTGWYE